MYLFHTNNYEHRLTMISIKSNIKVSFKLPKAIITGAFIIGTAMSAAHSELVIQEKDPSTTNSTSNQFNALKNADIRSPQLHQFVAELNQRLTDNPKEVEKYLSGKTQVMGFFVGQAMKASKGKANPGMLNKILADELSKLSKS